MLHPKYDKYGLKSKLDGSNENPLDQSPQFDEFLLACRHGDLPKCQELIDLGVNINGKDKFDYTPLIIASLCGHYELVQLLLESGALAERNTFQGERCIYNALNDRIRQLLLQYDFSKTSNPYVYWSTHITGLLARTNPQTSDISLVAGSHTFRLHKFLLASRTHYFRRELEVLPETESWRFPPNVPLDAVHLFLRYLYLGDLPRDLVPAGGLASKEGIAKALDDISHDLGIETLWDAFMAGGDRRLARQRFQDEEHRALQQVDEFFHRNVLGRKVVVDLERVDDVKWEYNNPAFADVFLRADEQKFTLDEEINGAQEKAVLDSRGIPLDSVAEGNFRPPSQSVLYPVHKAMLIRSEYFDRMFSGEYVEAQRSTHLIVVKVDCSPAVLELVLSFLYTEKTNCPLEHALDLLYAADMLFIDRLKTKAAVAISTLGSGRSNVLVDRTHPAGSRTHGKAEKPADAVDLEPINIYDVIHAAWDLRVQRLEEFSARYLATRLEDYIDDPDFQELIRESAARIRLREETDTIELLDDIRYYLSERFRLRFEDAGLDEMLTGDGESISSQESTLDAAHDRSGAVIAGQVDASEHAPDGGTEKGVAGGGGGGAAAAAAAVLTLDGRTAEDEFASDFINYQILLDKIDAMLERLQLDA
ncbi:hypothetical protein DCS_05032 [Drechmeria coniospora]|uniref:BTB domain-containing protein n=1 Tax=Drechmeria coniospora TaxID=98403 RepID=A0A151GLN7_DRECN|nr:hypothetical protein DCS_05032 [Drechmeria coniospora]KYK58019.1 hypothetical protein DCS_05032 [Drechmeria coniospora]